MTNYKKCPFCGAVRMLYQVLDGEHVRICYKCFKMQKRVTVPAARAKTAALNLALICSLMAGPVWAEQVVLDGQEFRAHVARDQRVQQERDALKTDRDNLEQQVGLYRQNEVHYKKTVTALKELQAKTDEKAKAQESLIATYEAQRVQLVQERQEFADEARRVKKEQAELAWKERGASFAAGVIATSAVVAFLLRGGR